MDKLIAPLADLLKWLFRLHRRPVLAIEFDRASEPFLDFGPEGREHATAYYRLLVRNDGRERAEGCEGFLVSIRRYILGQRVGDLFGRPERLKWAHEADFKSIAIEAGSDARKLDLFFIHQSLPYHAYLYIDRGDSVTGMPHFVEPGQYVFKVRVVSENSPTSTAEFVVDTSRAFDRATIERLA